MSRKGSIFLSHREKYRHTPSEFEFLSFTKKNFIVLFKNHEQISFKLIFNLFCPFRKHEWLRMNFSCLGANESYNRCNGVTKANPQKGNGFCVWWPQTIAHSLSLLTDSSQDHGGNTRKPAITQGELDMAVKRHQPHSRTGVCCFVWGVTRGVLPKPYKMTPSRLLVWMFLTKLSETDSTRVSSEPNILQWDLCSQPSTVQLEWHPRSLHRWAGSHWARVTDMKESRDAVVNFMVPVTSSMNGLVVGQWLFQGGPAFFLLQDNVWPLVVKVGRQSLDNEGIDATDWPLRPPDLNPFEHLWTQFH